MSIGNAAVRTPNSRTRRRLVVAVALVALCLGVLHWRLTRGVDARLVGTWLVTCERFRDIVGEHNRYGRGAAYRQRNGQRLLMVRYSWNVRGTSLESSSENDNKELVGWLKREWEIVCQKFAGEPVYTEHYQIVDVGQDVIVLDNLDTSERFTLRRLGD